MFKIYFCNLAIGQEFAHNGSEWKKSSSRTAWLAENGRVFYFSKTERVLTK